MEEMTENAAVAEEQVGGGLGASLVDIFLDPSKVFKRIEAGLQWWKAFIILAVGQAAIVWFSAPVNVQVARLNERGLSQEQLTTSIEMMERFSWVGVVLAPLGMLVVLMIIAGLVNLIVNLVSARSDFKKVLSLICFAGLISLIEQAISVVILYVRGIETIEARADSIISLGPAALFSEAEGIMAALLQALSVFQIWYFIVFVFGVAAIFKISKSKAVIPAVVLWVIGVAFIFIGQSMANMGS